MSDTSVVVVGNCTREPEMRFTASEMAVASFSVAVTARRKAENGSWENGDTSFFDVTAFGRLAENVGDSISKGQRVIVSGTLKQSSWEKDGQKRTKIEIIADEVGPSLKWDSIVQGDVSIPSRKSKFVEEEPF